MAHLFKFGIENFRVFADYTEFEFAPITILTGPNNSGKSSLIKSIALLRSYWDQSGYLTNELDLSKGVHGLGKFSSIINDQSKPLRFEIPTSIYGVDDLMMLSLSFSDTEDIHKDSSRGSFRNPKLVSVELFIEYENKKKEIFKCSVKEDGSDDWYVDFEYLINKFNQSLPKKVKGKGSELRLSEHFFDNLRNHFFSALPVHVGILKQKQSAFVKKTFVDIADRCNKQANHYIRNQIPSYIILNKYLLEKGLTDKPFLGDNPNRELLINYLQRTRKKSKKEIDQILKDYLIFLNAYLNDILNRIPNEECVVSGDDPFLVNHSDFFKDSRKNFPKYVESFFKALWYRLLRDNSIDPHAYYSHLEPAFGFLLKDLISDGISFVLQNASSMMSNIYSIAPTRGFEQRFQASYSETNMVDLLGQFIKLDSGKNETIKSFFEKWLNEFGYDGKIQVDSREEDIGFFLRLNKRLVADYGYGASKLLPLLFGIVNVYSLSLHGFRYPETVLNIPQQSTITIEEPEANLHPRLQSLLADMFIDANKQFNIQFILETHSEYLIRKLQYLTAEGEQIAPSDTAIYYFHDPKNVPEGEKQVKRINILEDGRLSDNFGPGFYDEALDLSFDLMRVRSRKHK